MADGGSRINALWNGIEVSLMFLLALALLVLAAYVRTVSEASLAQVALMMGTVFSFAVLMSIVAIWRIRMEHIMLMTTVPERGGVASKKDE